ncbi:hypothetical protein PAXRUDRAFT_562788 [Paxillus rubicundulus Ve08.2h10]|uniref:Uncharacterized protein n=1 Tax=Paxillus rubicundulus Ve08.2h10 TaxID=930991 RepID=A0A0D0DUD7_9AGAM|nr:hypothetical protein PAXRUDRAFT_562788 [Paxillus rubicundulus Ve08.2h10]
MLIQPVKTENEHINISDLLLGTLRGYRTFAFPEEVSNISHDPHLSLDSADEWVTMGVSCYINSGRRHPNVPWTSQGPFLSLIHQWAFSKLSMNW